MVFNILRYPLVCFQARHDAGVAGQTVQASLNTMPFARGFGGYCDSVLRVWRAGCVAYCCSVCHSGGFEQHTVCQGVCMAYCCIVCLHKVLPTSVASRVYVACCCSGCLNELLCTSTAVGV